MKKILLSLVFTLLFLISFCSFSQTPSEILQNKLDSFHSITANFVQRVFNADGTVLQKSDGNMSIKRPGKFRWNTDQPLKQLILTDGQKIWIFDQDLQQVTIKPFSKNIGQTPVLLLTSSHAYLNKSFNITQIKSTDNTQWFKLIPKDNNEIFSEIKIEFSGNILNKMQLDNQLGQKTEINFMNVVLNPSLDDNLFNFIPPKDVDVLDQTK